MQPPGDSRVVVALRQVALLAHHYIGPSPGTEEWDENHECVELVDDLARVLRLCDELEWDDDTLERLKLWYIQKGWK